LAEILAYENGVCQPAVPSKHGFNESIAGLYNVGRT